MKESVIYQYTNSNSKFITSNITSNIGAILPQCFFAIFTIFANIPSRLINIYATLRQYYCKPMIPFLHEFFSLKFFIHNIVTILLQCYVQYWGKFSFLKIERHLYAYEDPHLGTYHPDGTTRREIFIGLSLFFI